ncbi:MAG: SemiSWEET transporter [Pseudomonadota bacterium]
MNVDLIGSIAAILTTISFVPQAFRVIRTGDTAAISLTMYLLFTGGVALWGVYGFLIASKPIIASNAVTLALALIILTQKVRHLLVKGR